MLTAALGRASDRPPIGFLGSQVLNERGHGCWCDGGELIFGLTYALEALPTGGHRSRPETRKALLRSRRPATRVPKLEQRR